jgi:hypothetical protein
LRIPWRFNECLYPWQAASENDESRAKRSKQDEEGGNEKDGAKAKTKAEPKAAGDGNQKQSKDNSKAPEPPKDYIHVRARRGQATDSHSLAERVRIMKVLCDLFFSLQLNLDSHLTCPFCHSLLIR